MSRVLIVDFNHIAYNLAFGGGRLSSVVNGEVVDTTVPNGALKNIMRWSNFGKYPTAICFDRPCAPRKLYFKQTDPKTSFGEVSAYKATRDKMPSAMFQSIGLTEQLLRSAGVACYAKEGYEADDLIKACIDSAKEKYPDYKIDIITGDSDLLPLVDDSVSVFYRSKKATWAESADIRKNKYIQVMPANFREVVGSLSAFKDFEIPYNLLLLLKLTRGDDSDNIPGMKKSFPPKKVKEILRRMVEKGFTEIRYGAANINELNKWGIPEELTQLLDFLSSECADLLGEDELSHIRRIYLGINLNQPYFDLDKGGFTRKSVRISGFEGFKPNALVVEGKRIGINVPIG